MKAFTFLFFFGLCGFLITSCTHKDDNDLQKDQLTLPYGQWVDAEGASWLLTDSILDSRCPNNPLILCIWEGVAEGKITVDIAGTMHQVPFQVRGMCTPGPDPCGNILDTLGYHIQFIGLDPYPVEVDEIPKQDYILKLEVKKL